MVKFITRILGIHVLPNWLLFHFSLLAIVLGGINAVLFITAVSSFLLDGQIASFPEVIAFSGLAGILIYNFTKLLLKRFTFINVFIIYYSTLTFLVILAYLLPMIFPLFSQSFLLFLFWLPLTSISDQMLFFFTEKIPFTDNRQNLKRYIEAMLIIGTVLFSLIIALLGYFGIKPFALIAILPLVGIVIFESIHIFKKLNIDTREPEDEERIESIITFLSDIPLKFKVILVLAFVFLSVINFVFIDFSFLNVLINTYPDFKELVPFLGVFFATVMLVNQVLKLFVYQNLIKTFRISMALFIPPLFMIGVLLAINVLMLIPSMAEFYNPTSIAFLLIILSRFFAFLWRESFELQSLRIIYSALSKYMKRVISSNLTNLLGLWALLMIGLVLLLIKSIEPFSLRINLLINSGFVVIWAIVAFVLNKNYADILNKIIKKISSEPAPSNQLKEKNLKDRIMVTTNLSGMKYLLNYQRFYQPYNFQKTLKQIPDNIQSKLGLNQFWEDIPDGSRRQKVVSMQSSDNVVSSQLNFYDADENLRLTEIEALATSIKIKDRIRAVKMIESTHDFKYINIMKMLLRDQDDEVKRNAIMSVSTYYNPEIIKEILEYINHEEFSNLVSDVLSAIGADAVQPLTVVFNRSDINFRTQSQIIKILAKIKSKQSQKFLLDILKYPNKWIVFDTVEALKEHKFHSSLQNTEVLDTAIFNTIGCAAWLLSISVSMDSVDNESPAKKAVEEEYMVTLNLLFKLLELKYDERLISEIKKDFLTASENEKRELNVEILNLLVDKNLKKILFPLLHNNQKKEKIEQLKNIFPVTIKELEVALREVINADLGLVSTWTKACAIKMYMELDCNAYPDDILAQTFNPDSLISELAFHEIYRKDQGLAADLMDRLPVHFRKKLHFIFNQGSKFEYKLLFNKVLCLQRNVYFKGINGYQLLPFAEILDDQYIPKGNSTYLRCSEEEVLPVFIIPEGKMSMVDFHNRSFRLNNNSLYGLGLYSGGITLKAASESIVYIARPDQVGSLVINHEELSDALYKYIQNSNFY